MTKDEMQKHLYSRLAEFKKSGLKYSDNGSVLDAIAKQLSNSVKKELSKEELDRTFNSVVNRFVDSNSENLSENEAMEYYSKYPVNKGLQLDFNKMLLDGDIQLGKGLTESDVRRLAYKNKVSVDELKSAMEAARKEYVANVNAKAEHDIGMQRNYMAALMDNQDEMIAKMENEADPELKARYEQIKKDYKPGFLANAAKYADIYGAGGSEWSHYLDQVRNPQADDSDDLQFNRAMLADALYSGASLAVPGKPLALLGKAAPKLSKAITISYKHPVGKGAARFGQEALLGGGLEAGREAVAGEDINLGNIVTAGTSDATANGLIGFGASQVASLNIPGFKQMAEAIKAASQKDADFDARAAIAKEYSQLEKALKSDKPDDLAFVLKKYDPKALDDAIASAFNEYNPGDYIHANIEDAVSDRLRMNGDALDLDQAALREIFTKRTPNEAEQKLIDANLPGWTVEGSYNNLDKMLSGAVQPTLNTVARNLGTESMPTTGTSRSDQRKEDTESRTDELQPKKKAVVYDKETRFRKGLPTIEERMSGEYDIWKQKHISELLGN